MHLPQDPEEIISVRLTRTELTTLNNALNEILSGPEAIPEWEFQTRIGVLSADAKMLLQKVSKMLELGRTGIA